MKRVLDHGNSNSHEKKVLVHHVLCLVLKVQKILFHVTKSESHMKACSSCERMYISHVENCEKSQKANTTCGNVQITQVIILILIIIITSLHNTKLELRGEY